MTARPAPRRRLAAFRACVIHFVHSAGCASLEIRGDTGEDVLGFAYQHVVGELLETLGLAGGPWPSDEGPRTARPRSRQHGERVDPLGVHRTDHHQVGPAVVVVGDVVERVIEQAKGPGGRAESGNRD
jgi:hypothetical protein